MKILHSLRSRKFLLLALAASAQTAYADVRFPGNGTPATRAKVEVGAIVQIIPDPAPVSDVNFPPEEFGILNFEQSIVAQAKKEGLSANARTQQSTSIDMSANSLICTSNGFVEARSTHTGDPAKDNGTRGSGKTTFSLIFVVDGTTSISFNASGSVEPGGTEGSAAVRVRLTGSGKNQNGATVEVSEIGEVTNQEDAQASSFSLSKVGKLLPGTYSLQVTCSDPFGSGAPLSRSKYSVSLTVHSSGDLEPLGNEFHWIRRGIGAFSEPANWNPHAVPVRDSIQEDAALFDLRGSYTVDLGGGVPVVEVIRVKGGSAMTLSNGVLLAASKDLAIPSLIITGNAGLTIPNGTGLLTVGSIVGNDPGTTGELRVVGSSASLRASGSTIGGPLTERFIIGGDGTGRLTVSAGGSLETDDATVGGGLAPGFATVTGQGSRWDTQKLTVGNPSEGKLGILLGGVVASAGRVEIGSGASNRGLSSLLVQGLGISGLPSELLVNRGGIFVGKDMPASLEVSDGGLVKLLEGPDFRDGSLSIGNLSQVRVRGERGNHAQATVEAKNVLVDDGGSLLIEAGGLVKSSGFFFVGGDRGRGDVTVDGLSRLGALSELRVTSPNDLVDLGGTNTDGVLNVLNSGLASIVCQEMHIGSDSGGHGAVFLSSNNPTQPDSLLSVTGALKVGSPAPGGGTGLLRITDSNSTVEVNGDVLVAENGRIDGRGTLIVTGTLRNSGFISPGLSPGILTVEGNFEQDATGVVLAEVGGAAPGTQHDQFLVTGTSTMGGKLILQFINGYAPKAGDHFNVINSTGAVAGDFAEIEVGGLEPGAQFQTAVSGGAFTATAMNDTTALPTISIHAVGKKAFERGRRSSALLVSRKGTKASKANPLAVSYAISGTAENGIDYTFLSGSVTIPAGKSAVVLKLTPFDDSSFESAETAEFQILPGANYSNSLRSTARVTIVNNSRPQR